MNIDSLNEHISSNLNEYDLLERIYLVLFPWKLTSISFPWSWTNTIPWSCINIQLLDVKWCLEYKYILLSACEYIHISWILQQNKRLTINPVYTVQYKQTRVRPGLKLTQISFCRVSTANPSSTRASLEKCRVNTIRVSLNRSNPG